MAYTIKFPDEVTEEMVRDMVYKIEPACYPGDTYDPEHGLDIYRANDLTYLALLHDESLIGYLSMFPVSPRTYGAIMSGDTSYRERIELKDILPYEGGNRYKLLIDSISVLPRRQKLAAAELLVDGAYAFISMLALRGVEIDEIICYEPDEELLPLLKTGKLFKARTASDGTVIYSSKTPDRRRKESAATRKKIDGVIGLVADYCDLPRKQVNGNTAFAADLGLEATDMATLKPLIEEKLGTQISEKKYAEVAQVKDFAYLL